MPDDDFDFEKVLDDVEKETDAQFASRVSKLTKLTPPELKELCPTQVEREELDRLISIVGSGASSNEQRARLVENAGKLGNILLAVVKKAIVPLA